MDITRCGLAIFVKTPGYSPLKTRLAKDIGQETAESIYKLCAMSVASVVSKVARYGALRPYWAIAENQVMHSRAWPDLQHLSQGGGELGSRMSRIYEWLRTKYGAAILIGADAPQISIELLNKAIDTLQTRRRAYVMGRAVDGGFWLIGGNIAFSDIAWRDTMYSSPDTADVFQRNAGDGNWYFLDTLCDLDTVDDIPRVLQQLEQLGSPTTEQYALIDSLHARSPAAPELSK
jgi:uncharacterized protein